MAHPSVLSSRRHYTAAGEHDSTAFHNMVSRYDKARTLLDTSDAVGPAALEQALDLLESNLRQWRGVEGQLRRAGLHNKGLSLMTHTQIIHRQAISLAERQQNQQGKHYQADVRSRDEGQSPLLLRAVEDVETACPELYALQTPGPLDSLPTIPTTEPSPLQQSCPSSAGAAAAPNTLPETVSFSSSTSSLPSSALDHGTTAHSYYPCYVALADLYAEVQQQQQQPQLETGGGGDLMARYVSAKRREEAELVAQNIPTGYGVWELQQQQAAAFRMRAMAMVDKIALLSASPLLRLLLLGKTTTAAAIL